MQKKDVFDKLMSKIRIFLTIIYSFLGVFIFDETFIN